LTAVSGELRYILELVSTMAGTGAFAPIPEGRPELAVVLDRLQSCPQDSFLHRYALEMLAGRSAGCTFYAPTIKSACKTYDILS
jgi:hypothetical protein